MYAGRVMLPMVSRVCAACPIKVREKAGRTDGQTDGCHTEILRFPIYAVSVIIF